MARFGQLSQGEYRLRVVGAAKDEISATAAFDVRGNLQEWLETAARPDVMAMLAQTSGGAVLDNADPQSLARRFEGATGPQSAGAGGADHGLGPLVGARGGVGALGRRVGVAAAVGIDVRDP